MALVRKPFAWVAAFWLVPVVIITAPALFLIIPVALAVLLVRALRRYNDPQAVAWRKAEPQWWSA